MKRFLLVLLVILVLAIPIQAQGPIYLPIITKGDSCMGIAKLAISDGTTEISLLDLNGIHLAEDDGWTPKIIQAKGGGVFQDSSMAAGRRLVYRQFGTAREDFTFNIMGISQDELIAQTSDLLMMLEKAVNYWATDWQSDIVYLIAQSDCETYARYAPILNYEAPELQNPYGQPFVQAGDGAIFDDIGIMIERGHWQNIAPGDSECAETNSVQEWLITSASLILASNALSSYAYSFEQTTTGRLLAGDNGEIWYSDDDGVNWASLTALPVSNVRVILQLSSGRILAGDNGQIWYSDNNGTNWNLTTAVLVSIATSMIQTKSGRILVGDAGQIVYSDDNGNNWSTLTFPIGAVYSLLQLSSGRILAGDNNNVWKSDDNGNTWEIASSSFTDSAVWSLVQADNENILAGDLNKIWISYNDGDSWSEISTLPSGNVRTIIKMSSGRLYAGDFGQFLVSYDNGITWSVFNTDPVDLIYGMFETNTERLLIGDLNRIWRYGPEDIIDMGASDSCDGDVYVVNKQNISNLTDIYISDGGVFSANLINAVLPYNLLPAIPAANDAIYFGINNTVANGGAFSSIVFDIAENILYTVNYTITWEYSNGAAGWPGLTLHDDTDTGSGAFRKLGTCSIHFTPPAAWATEAVNGVTAYWIRARLSALVGTITPPSQQNRNIYTATNGYLSIDDTTILGDISSLMQAKLENRSDEDGPGGNSPNFYDNRIIVGLKSYDRGNDFQSYINISDRQNPSGITISVGTNTTIGNDIVAPTGRSATYNPGGVEAMATRATVTLSTTIARDFYGSYHAFLRVQRTAGASTDFDVQLVFITGSGGIQKTTESKQVQTTTAFELLDFGQVTIPVGGSLASSDLGDQIQILIQASAASGTPNLVLYDLILIPVDEWAIDSVDQTNSSTSDIGRSGDISKLLDIDSVTDPKNPIKSIVRQVGSDFVTANYNPITNGPAILQSNVDQRLWFLAAQTSATGSSYSWIAPPEIVHSVQLFKAQRYLGLRGNR